MLKARQTSWKGNYDEAITIYEQLIKENPKDIEAMLGLATVLSCKRNTRNPPISTGEFAICGLIFQMENWVSCA